ncbi:MAG TPA: MoaD/ThiS family protein [Euryarchaeota archaeon]|nr:sulfur carrier protein ThiS [archaeon BMS3Abin16]HDH28577.1 MoaD/ThiS family protein [Euryarchaeota archaeon]HDY73498.1 MoaD/ThiS family protein [Euryarchaeota archaeon]
MIVFVDGKKKDISKEDCRVCDLLEELGVNREAVVTVVNGEITVEETELSEGDEIKIISAVSGG